MPPLHVCKEHKQSDDVVLFENSNLTSPGPFLSGVDSVGTISSALVTYAAIQALQPDLIINAGTAGGFKVSTVFVPLSCQYCYISLFSTPKYLYFVLFLATFGPLSCETVVLFILQ